MRKRLLRDTDTETKETGITSGTKYSRMDQVKFLEDSG